MLLRKANDILEILTGRRMVVRSEAAPKDDCPLLELARIRDKYINPSDMDPLEKRFLMFAIENLQYSRSQLLQDLWVIWELNELKNGCFVEFGAYDGQLLSNTKMLESRYDWSGLLAEPNTDLHDSIARNRRASLDKRCVYFENNSKLIFDITDEPEYSTISSFSEGDMHSKIRANKKQIVVETVTLSSMLSDHEIPDTVDYLSIDTEGSEFEILCAYDWGRHIRCISVEHNFSKNQERVDDLLKSRGYIRRFSRLSCFDGWYIAEKDVLNR
jgi:FkbM family methyltransferase